MCGLLDCCRASLAVVRRHAVFCRILVFAMVYMAIMTLKLSTIASPTTIEFASGDEVPATKRLTPSSFDAVDLPDSRDRSTSSAGDGNGTAAPLLVHVIWFFPPDTPLRFHEALALLAVQRYARPRKILLWYDSASTPPTGRWWQFARQSVAHLLPVPYERPTSVFNQTVAVVEHQSDVARLALIDQYGGLYIDLDVILVRPLGRLRRFDVVLGAETPYLLGSGFILARLPGSKFVRLWRQAYADNFNDSRWNEHSCKVPMRLARRHPDLVHVEWFAIHRPNWHERRWLFVDGQLWDWSDNFAVHLWFRTHPPHVVYDPLTIRRLNTTSGEVFRHIYYGDTRLLPAIASEHRDLTEFRRTTTERN